MRVLIQNLRTAVKLFAVLVILIVANLAVDRYDRRWDLTEARLYTLSPKTRATVRDLKRDVELLFFHTDELQSGPADPGMIRRLLRRYDDQGPRLSFREIDPTRSPNLAREYEIRENNTIVVRVGERTNLINSFDLYEYGPAPGGAAGPRRGSRRFRGESAVTAALIQLTESTDRIVYFTTGSGEYERQPGRGRTAAEWVSGLEQEGYGVETLNPLVGTLPDTADLVVLLDPRQGLAPDAARRLRRWRERGGHLLVAASPSAARDVNPILRGSGIRFAARQIVASRARRHPMAPLLFTPILEGHPAVAPLRDQGLTVLAGQSTYLETTGDTPASILSTGSEAYAKPLFGPEEEFRLPFDPATDVRGPFTVAAAAAGDTGGRLVAVGSAQMLGDRLLSQAAGNHNLAVNLVNWMLERQVSLEIGSVPLDYNRVQVTSSQANALYIVALVLLPLAILIWGGTVWWKRRNR